MGGNPRLRVYTDGGARGNPGPAATGVVLVAPDGTVLRKEGATIGVATNNQAEYAAMARGLQLAAIYWTGHVECIADSELVIRQLVGRYKVKNETLREMFMAVKRLESSFLSVTYTHVPRENEWTAMADALVNEALDAASTG